MLEHVGTLVMVTEDDDLLAEFRLGRADALICLAIGQCVEAIKIDGGSLHCRFAQAIGQVESALYPGQAVKAPAVQFVAMTGSVLVALETLQDVVAAIKARFCCSLGSGTGTRSGTTEE